MSTKLMDCFNHKKWSPTGKARGSQETPTRGEHPVPKDQFTHGLNLWSSWFGIEFPEGSAFLDFRFLVMIIY